MITVNFNNFDSCYAVCVLPESGLEALQTDVQQIPNEINILGNRYKLVTRILSTELSGVQSATQSWRPLQNPKATISAILIG
jgi:hypothetical protein